MKKKAKNKKITVDKLAIMVQNGFLENTKVIMDRMTQGFSEVNKNIRILSENNANDHLAMNLRLDNKANNFEVAELDKRVMVLEKKTGVRK